MENLKSQLDLYLTEISLELLGNRVYDINGKREGKLSKLFEAMPTSEQQSPLLEDSNDFLCSLGFHQNYAEKNIKDLFESQLDYILSSSNSCHRDNQEIMKCLKNYKFDQDLLVNELASFTLKKQIGESIRWIKCLNYSETNRFLPQKLPKLLKTWTQTEPPHKKLQNPRTWTKVSHFKVFNITWSHSDSISHSEISRKVLCSGEKWYDEGVHGPDPCDEVHSQRRALLRPSRWTRQLRARHSKL